ncbi:MAG: hypothetical protein ABIJ97_09340 [Bacteroidota bacterium]
MKKWFILINCFFILFSAIPQKSELGITYSPILVSKLTFDKSYIIFNDYSSLTAGDNKFHSYASIFSVGIFYKYKFRNIYLQTEFNIFENRFGQQIPDWVTTSRDNHFAYSSIDIPFLCGITINPASMIKFRFYAGLNNKIGKFKIGYYSSLKYLFDQPLNNEVYFTDTERKKELQKKFSFFIEDIIAGAGISVYGTSIDLRIEHNITNLNKKSEVYNANFNNTFLIRLYFGFKLYNKKLNTADKYQSAE